MTHGDTRFFSICKPPLVQSWKKTEAAVDAFIRYVGAERCVHRAHCGEHVQARLTFRNWVLRQTKAKSQIKAKSGKMGVSLVRLWSFFDHTIRNNSPNLQISSPQMHKFCKFRQLSPKVNPVSKCRPTTQVLLSKHINRAFCRMQAKHLHKRASVYHTTTRS